VNPHTSCLTLRIALSLAVSLLGVSSALAQDFKDKWAAFYKEHYSSIPKPELIQGLGSNISNKVVKPEGNGPFPAVLLVHTAGGLANDHIKDYARALLGKGYVVLIQDSLGPRGIPFVSRTTPRAHPQVGVRDAYQGLEYLAQQSYVDKNRIYQMGTSWGGFVASSLASKGISEVNDAKVRFRASAGLYSSCGLGSTDPYRFIFSDFDRPILLLLAGDDKELKPGNCFQELQALKDKGLPLDFHVYEGIGHAWDKKGELRFGYVYNEEITKNAFDRVLAFFEKYK
jgi:dienelactone hydrolase